MQAVVKHSARPQDLSVQSMDLRTELKPNEALVQIRAAGICGSDLHMYAGHDGYDWIQYPLILGHEMTGVVENVGNNRFQSWNGRRVIINPYIPCGQCDACLRGEENCCDRGEYHVQKQAPQSLQYGFRQHGGMAEYMIVPIDNLLPIGDSLDDSLAAVAEAIAVGATAVAKLRDVEKKKIVVFGPGPIGLGVTSILKSQQAYEIVVVGVAGDEERLSKALSLGADHVIEIGENGVESLLQYQSDGYDALIDCSGHHTVPEIGVQVLRKAGEMVLVGISTQRFTLPMDQIVRGELQVRGSYGITREILRQTLTYMEQDPKRFQNIISHQFSLSEAPKAFIQAHNRAAGKVVIRMN